MNFFIQITWNILMKSKATVESVRAICFHAKGSRWQFVYAFHAENLLNGEV